MMSLEEIRVATINPLVAREAYDQASRRLEDILDTKKAYEQKAFTLFSGYLTVTLALLGVAGAVFKDAHHLTHLVVSLWLTGGVFGIGAVFLMLALLDKGYGAAGSDPQMWLTKDTIDGPDERLSLMLAYVAYHHQERIDTSIKANEAKAFLIRCAIVAGVAAPILLCCSLLIPDANLKAFL